MEARDWRGEILEKLTADKVYLWAFENHTKRTCGIAEEPTANPIALYLQDQARPYAALVEAEAKRLTFAIPELTVAETFELGELPEWYPRFVTGFAPGVVSGLDVMKQFIALGAMQ
jgi:hypothetical protein